jgi:hypothetical protein
MINQVPGGEDHFATMGANMVAGKLPKEVMQAISRGKIVPFLKPNGGTRPIVIPSVIMRMVAGAVGRIVSEKVREACEPEQHGVGTSGGAELLYHTAVAMLACEPEWGVLSLDEENAFGSLNRAAVADAAMQAIPTFGPFVRRLLEADEENIYVDDKGEIHKIAAKKGVPQGMPLSPYLFPLTLRGPLRELRNRVANLEGGGMVLAYQDDIYVLAKPKHYNTVYTWAESLLADVGLKLNVTKTYYWARPNIQDPMQWINTGNLEWKGAKRDMDIKILRQSLPTLLTRQAESDESTRQKAIERRRNLCKRVAELAHEGMGTHPAFALLRAAVPADASFITRTHLLDENTCKELDRLVMRAAELLTGVEEWSPIKKAWAALPVSAGGLGINSMEIVAPCAYVAAWRQGIACITNQTGVLNLPELLLTSHVLEQPMTQAIERGRRMGIEMRANAGGAEDRTAKESQGQWTSAANWLRREQVLEQLGPEESAILRGAGGKGAGAWLEAHDGGDVERMWLTDAEFSAAMAIRMGLTMKVEAGCLHKTAAGMRCNQNLAQGNRWHPLLCTHGPGHNARHTNVAKALAKCIQKEMETAVQLEQAVPGWDRQGLDGQLERARLDIVTHGWDGRTRYIDVVVMCTVGRSAACAASPNADGALAQRMEAMKRARYPGPNLIPAAIEHPGRMGPAFVDLIRWVCSKRHLSERGMTMRAIYREISMALQQSNARMMLEAGCTARMVGR